MRVDEQGFIAGSRETWERLAYTLDAARVGGVARMEPDALRRLHEDYRRTAADLAYAQTHFPASRTATYLNALVGRAHAELYGAPPRRLAAAGAFLIRGYPALVRRYRREVALAAALLFGAAALGHLLAYVNYPLARLFIPEALRDGVADALERGGDAHALFTSIAPVLSAGITVNNIQVALLAFAGGITFGVVTTYALVVNGLLIGALAGSFAKAGGAVYFWSLIVPHGSLELPAIVLAGAAGLLMARSLVAPGDLPRSTALRAVTPDALRLLLGTIPLFVIAGFIEAFVTPLPIAEGVKLALGGVLTVAVLSYLALAGRGAPDAEPARQGRS